MLKALKAQLTQLSQESDKTLEKRFYKEANLPQAKDYAPDLQNFILSLPDLLNQIRIWFESDETPRDVKPVYGYLLTYLYHSVDFLPEEEYGFWGYLDDAYLAGMVYQKTLPYHANTTNRADTQFVDQINNWLDKTRQVIPQHTEKLDQLLGKVLQGDTEFFHAAIIS